MNDSSPVDLPDFAACRARFLQTCRDKGANVVQYRHAGRGPHGEELACDVARFGSADASRVAIVASGTHGLEGPAGSAVQSAWMQGGGPARLPDDVAVLLVHAVNPYGFAFGRRNEEHNVDPNRNFLQGGAAFPDNAGYRELHPVLCPREWDETTLQAINTRLEEYGRIHGYEQLKRAVAAGQREFPRGLFYCGDRESWPVRTTKRILASLSPRVRSVAYLDLHTGLGAYGESVYLCFQAPGSAGRERARRWYGSEAIDPPTPADGRSDRYDGLMYDGIEHCLAGREPTIVCLEFGTLPPMEIIGALLLEHWLHFHGGKHRPENRHLVRQIQEAFVPSDERWLRKVIAAGSQTIDRTVDGLASEP